MKKLLIVLAGVAALAAIALGSAVAHNGASGRSVSIVHVQKGCHTWANGRHMSATMRLTVPKGGTLMITNNDIDVHRLVQTAGPRLALRHRTMKTGGRMTVVFRNAGSYRFTTRVVEDGMAMKPDPEDNVLRLIVRVG